MNPELYTIRIIRRAMTMTRDDYHATVTRQSDGKQLVFISDYKWLLKLKTRAKALQRAYKRQDKYDRKIKEEDVFTR